MYVYDFWRCTVCIIRYTATTVWSLLELKLLCRLIAWDEPCNLFHSVLALLDSIPIDTTSILLDPVLVYSFGGMVLY